LDSNNDQRKQLLSAGGSVLYKTFVSVMINYNHRIKHLIIIIFITIFPFVGITQLSDSLVYCEHPDNDAQPPFKIHELLNIILDSQHNEMPDCFDPSGTFYFNIIIHDDGTVALLNLECLSNNSSCFINVHDVSTLEKWIPASQNGKNCNQKMRFKTYICFE
jgi:hypothetical protein